MTGCAVCYIVASFSSNVYVAFVSCILVGLCSSMLWPGSLILMEENVKGVGIAAYALMSLFPIPGASALSAQDFNYPAKIGNIIVFFAFKIYHNSFTTASYFFAKTVDFTGFLTLLQVSVRRG